MSKRYLFTWEESYLIHKELLRRKTNFTTKYGPDTVVSLSVWEHTPSEIMQILCSGGLFSEDKLIILYDIPGQTTSPKGTAELEEAIMTQREMLHPDYFIIFVSYKPDKRKKAYKFFEQHCESKTFSPMDMRSIPKFLSEEFNEYNTSNNTLTRDHIDHIVELVGTDGRRLSSEIKKLCDSLNAEWWQLTTQLINEVITPSQESTAFEIVDELVKAPSSSIVSKLDMIIASGEVRQAIHGWLLRWMKNIIAYGLCLRDNQDTKSLWLEPFVAGKYNKYQDNIRNNLEWYIHIYNKLLEYDYNIKNGITEDKWYRLHLKSLLFENNLIS